MQDFRDADRRQVAVALVADDDGFGVRELVIRGRRDEDSYSAATVADEAVAAVSASVACGTWPRKL